MPKILIANIVRWSILPLLLISLALGWFVSTLQTELANNETTISQLRSDVETKSTEITALTNSLDAERLAAQQLREEREIISEIHIAKELAVKELQARLAKALADNAGLRDHPDETVKNWVACPVPAAVSSLYKYASPGNKNSSANTKCLPAATGRADKEILP